MLQEIFSFNTQKMNLGDVLFQYIDWDLRLSPVIQLVEGQV